MIFRLRAGLNSRSTGAAAAVVALSLAAPATAQTDDSTQVAELGLQIKVQRPDDDGSRFIDMSSEELAQFFNLAHCRCNTQFAIEARFAGPTPPNLDSQDVQVWVGSDCLTTDTAERNRTCKQVAAVDINDFQSPQQIPISSRDLMWPNSTDASGCMEAEAQRNIYLATDPGGDGKFDYASKLPTQLEIDARPPPGPESVTVMPAENGLELAWALPSSRRNDIRSYQVLCARADDGSRPSGAKIRDAVYQTESSECGTVAPTIEDLHDMFVCSGEIAGTDTAHRIGGLQNGVEYKVLLVAIDEHLNPQPHVDPTEADLPVATPQAVVDFWEDYRSQGGDADGGYCFVATASYGNYNHPFVRVLRDFRDDTLAATAPGRWVIRLYYETSPPLAGFIADHPIARGAAAVALAPVVALAGLWVYTGWLGKLGLLGAVALAFALRRVRKRGKHPHPAPSAPAPDRLPHARRVAAGMAAVLVLVGWAAAASAQPYWDEGPRGRNPAVRSAVGPTSSSWAFELKFGPYTPEIDSEFAAGEGPYARMFGGNGLLTQVELDRFFFFPYGQLGLALATGWFRKSARAFATDPDGNILLDENGDPVRSRADETALRITPFVASVVYRWTALDDRVRIPVVPYGKLGLGYYLWSATRPDGDTSRTPRDPDCETGCAQVKGAGGTPGWQGTVGIAVRAERIDANAAHSLRNELGIEHAGFFVEYTVARIRGLGADNRLRVGDATWSAGVNFEF
jgi:hypothetical protein